MKNKKISIGGVNLSEIKDHKGLSEIRAKLENSLTVFQEKGSFIYFEPTEKLSYNLWIRSVVSLNNYKAGLKNDVVLFSCFGDEVQKMNLLPMVYTGEASHAPILFRVSLQEYITQIISEQPDDITIV